MTNAEIARAVCGWSTIAGPQTDPHWEHRDDCPYCPKIVFALDTARREALEEAAKWSCTGCYLGDARDGKTHVSPQGARTKCTALAILAGVQVKP